MRARIKILLHRCCWPLPTAAISVVLERRSVAQAFVESGLSKFVAQQLAVLSGLHPLVIIAAIALVVTFLTETTSNTATTVLLMPILAPAAIVAGVTRVS